MSKYKELKDEIDSGNLTDSEIYDKKQQIFEIQQSIVSEYGNQAAGIDLVNGKLETQLGLLRNINVENAHTKLSEAQSAYDDAIETLSGSWTKSLSGFDSARGFLSDGTIAHMLPGNSGNSSAILGILKKYEESGLTTSSDVSGRGLSIKFEGNAEQAVSVFDSFMADLRDLKNGLGTDAYTGDIDQILSAFGEIFPTLNTKVADALDVVKQYNVWEMWDDENSYKDSDISKAAYEWYYDYANAIDDYNNALLSGDDEKIAAASENFNKIDASVQALLAGDMSKYKVIFDDLAEGLNKSAVAAQEFEDAINGKGTKQAQKDIEKYAKELKSLKLSDIDFKDAFFTDGVQNGEDAINGMVSAAMELGLISDDSEASIQALIDKLIELDVITGTPSSEVEAEKYSFEKLFGSDSDIKSYVDDYIKNVGKLQEALEKFKSGKLESADIAELIAEFPELADGSDDLGHAITKLIDKMNTEAIAKFASQFGLLETDADREKLLNYEETVLEIGKLPTSAEFSIDVDYESSEFDNLTAAMEESISAVGLTADSIDNLKKRYQGLDSFNAGKLFENTASGIHLNVTELQRLETEYINTKKAQNQLDLENLTQEYDNLTARINACSNAAEAAALYNERATVEQKIQDCQTLAAQYDGLTSAYNRWQTAQSGGNERDMYETIGKGFDTTKDLIDQGWGGSQEVRSFVDLISNKDMSSASAAEVVAEFESFYKNIGSTQYSITDLFKFDDDGNITSEGIGNFFEVVQKELGEGFAKINSDGSLWFDFGNGKDQQIADALGVNVEVIQALLRAAIDAGVDVSLDSVWDDIDLTTTKAEQANAKLNEIFGTDYKIDFNSDDIDQVNSDLDVAKAVLDTFRDENGNIDISIDGAEEAQTVVATLIAKKNELEKPAIMSVDYSEADSDMAIGVKLLQNLWSANSSYEAYVEAGLDASQFEEQRANLVKEIQDLAAEHPEVVAALGIDTRSESTILDSINNLDPTILASLGFDTSGVRSDLQTAVDDAADGVSANVNVGVTTTYTNESNDNDSSVESGPSLADIKKTAKSAQYLLNKSTGTEFKIDFEASNLATINDDLEKIYKAKQAVTEDDGKTPLPGMEDQLTYINQMMTGLVAQKDSLTEPFIMSVNASGAEGEIYTVISQLQTLQSLTEEKTRRIMVGADTTDVQAEIDATVANINNASPEIKTSLGLDTTATYTDMMSVIGQIQTQADLQKIMVSAGVDETEVDSFLSGSSDKEAVVNYTVNHSAVDKYNPPQKSGRINYYASATYNGVALGNWTPPTKYGKIVYNESGSSGASGTATKPGQPGQRAVVNGTANLSGTANAHGYWGVPTKTRSLTGELGPEIIVSNGQWYTVGNNGAEFVDIPKDAIVFNHKQTEALLKYGKVTGRGKSFANGSAFSNGSGGLIKKPSGGTSAGGGKKPSSSSSKSPSSSSSSSSSGSSAEETAENLDWIEVLIDRIERRISNLETTADSAFRKMEIRTAAVADKMSEISDEIEYQSQAYEAYINAADDVGLSDYYKELVQDGSILLEEITDEDLNDKISKYRELYEKALDARDAIVELDESLRQLYQDRFDMVADRLDNIIDSIDARNSLLEEYVSQIEDSGHIVNEKYYELMIKAQRDQLNALVNGKNDLIEQLNAAVDSGKIEKYSEAWYDMQSKIDETKQSIAEVVGEIQNLNKEIRQLSWDKFDATREAVSYLNDEAEFLIDVLGRGDKLFDDKGNFEDYGTATMGLYAQRYETYLAQASAYAEEIKNIESSLATDPYNTELIERRQELIEAQRDSITAALDEKDAIVDLIKEGIDKQLDALSELIDKYKESLDSAKDAYEYQKKIKDQTEEIASLEKQLNAYQGDDSEETRATIQKLKNDLKDAQEDLRDTQYDQYVSDQKELLDDLYDSYEETLNARLDNIDALIAETIASSNANCDKILDTIKSAAETVGIDLSDDVIKIWSGTANGSNSASLSNSLLIHLPVISKVYDVGQSILEVIKEIQNSMNARYEYSSESGVIERMKQNSLAHFTASTSEREALHYENISLADRLSALTGGTVYTKNGSWYDKNGNLLYKLDKEDIAKSIVSKMKQNASAYFAASASEKNALRNENVELGNRLARVLGRKVYKDATGTWFIDGKKLFDVYHSGGIVGGGTLQDKERLSVLLDQEAVLTNDQLKSVAEQFEYLRDIAGSVIGIPDNPAAFVSDAFRNLPSGGSYERSSVTNTNNNDFKITFNLSNVKSYEEFMNAVTSDRKFEQFLQSVTVDRMAGKSKLSKNKYRWGS